MMNDRCLRRLSASLVTLVTLAGLGCGGNEMIELAPGKGAVSIPKTNANALPPKAPKGMIKNSSGGMTGPPGQYSK